MSCEQDQPGRPHHDRRKTIGPQQAGRAGKLKLRLPYDRQGIPRKTGEDPTAQPFADCPASGKGEDQGQDCARRRRALDAVMDPPCPACRQRGIDREIECQCNHGKIAEPDRHRRLKGKGDRDPVIACAEVADTEQPAEHCGTPCARCVAHQMNQKRKAEQGKRP